MLMDRPGDTDHSLSIMPSNYVVGRNPDELELNKPEGSVSASSSRWR